MHLAGRRVLARGGDVLLKRGKETAARLRAKGCEPALDRLAPAFRDLKRSLICLHGAPGLVRLSRRIIC
jgi:hypothetical protein